MTRSWGTPAEPGFAWHRGVGDQPNPAGLPALQNTLLIKLSLKISFVTALEVANSQM